CLSIGQITLFEIIFVKIYITMKYFLQMHKRLGPNQQTLRTLWTNGPLLLSRQERSERTSPFPEFCIM
ncbi:MAG: hypothetical protein J7K15_16120, partial [Deltaproteobacteria bacterium]|nr:hypothetical protein [Deltaproteobacteria bacterium]